LVEATGTQSSPDEVNQVISGDPTTTYTETYDKTVVRNDGSQLNLAFLGYSLDTISSGQGILNEYSFNATAESQSLLINNSGAETNFNFSSSIEFQTNTSFKMEAFVLSLDSPINEFSFWMDGSLIWSLSSGLEAMPVPDIATSGSSVLSAIYGQGTDFEVEFLALSTDSSSVKSAAIGLDVVFANTEPTHLFEIRTGWSAQEDTTSTFDLDLDIAPDLQFSVVPEVSQYGMLVTVIFMVVFLRRPTSCRRS